MTGELSLAEVSQGGLFTDGDWVESKDQDPAGTVRLTQLADVGVGGFRDRSSRWMREDQASRLNCTFLEPEDILIARMPDPLGRACLVPQRLGRAVTAVDVAVLRVRRPDVLPHYAAWMINAPQFRSAVESLQSGTTRKRISRKNLAALQIPVPDVEAQRRIVDTLEEHLSHLDSADLYLQQAVALSTALVSKQLSATRRGELVPLAEIAEIQGGIQKQQKRAPRDHAYPFLRVANVTAAGLDLADVHRVELFGDELDRLRLRRGDLLVVEGNGSPSQIGRAALWDGSIEDCVHQNHLIRVRANEATILPGYLEAVWNSPENRADLTEVSNSSSGLHTLSVSKLRRVLIPVPEPSVQIDALRELDTVRVAQRRLLHVLASASIRGSALRRALLAAAFAGRLTGRSSDMDVIEGLTEEESA